MLKSVAAACKPTGKLLAFIRNDVPARLDLNEQPQTFFTGKILRIRKIN